MFPMDRKAGPWPLPSLRIESVQAALAKRLFKFTRWRGPRLKPVIQSSHIPCRTRHFGNEAMVKRKIAAWSGLRTGWKRHALMAIRPVIAGQDGIKARERAIARPACPILMETGGISVR
ncbi:hypothetical protein Q4610_17005 [Sphingobium sp. HBC34]|uniref:Uncharacterized protein n=1 Tax=Sphingobium cyanobacteriorum TaxID=3063954 RepID=A0ABT8ZQC1_9SPHN|nr:hypothetical protein [Sphingobium sp. HBC34]MDO7836749.1 hypothetical protein [Sphingobium sp. HBC34]